MSADGLTTRFGGPDADDAAYAACAASRCVALLREARAKVAEFVEGDEFLARVLAEVDEVLR